MSPWGIRYRVLAFWGVALLMATDMPYAKNSIHSIIIASCFFLLAVVETTVLFMDWLHTRERKQLPKLDENIHDKWDRIYGTGKYRSTKP
jgi:hypothetical protein